MLQLRKTKKVFANFPRGFWRFPTKFQRFKKYCCPGAEDRAIFKDLRLRGLGQGLQNVSSRTSSRIPPLLIGADSHTLLKLLPAASNFIDLHPQTWSQKADFSAVKAIIEKTKTNLP